MSKNLFIPKEIWELDLQITKKVELSLINFFSKNNIKANIVNQLSKYLKISKRQIFKDINFLEEKKYIVKVGFNNFKFLIDVKEYKKEKQEDNNGFFIESIFWENLNLNIYEKILLSHIFRFNYFISYKEISENIKEDSQTIKKYIKNFMSNNVLTLNEENYFTINLEKIEKNIKENYLCKKCNRYRKCPMIKENKYELCPGYQCLLLTKNIFLLCKNPEKTYKNIVKKAYKYDTLNDINDTLNDINDTLNDINDTLDTYKYDTLNDINDTLNDINDTLNDKDDTHINILNILNIINIGIFSFFARMSKKDQNKFLKNFEILLKNYFNNSLKENQKLEIKFLNNKNISEVNL
jgi:uncharacterized protein YukE